MSRQPSDDRSTLLAEVEDLFIGFGDGQLSAAEEKRLAELLRTSDAAREHYLRLTNVRVGLHWRLRMANDEMLAGVESSHTLTSAARAGRGEHRRPATNAFGKLTQRLPTAIDYRTHPWRFGGTALAITLLCWTAFFTYMWPWIQRRPSPIETTVITPEIAAELVDTFDAEFASDKPSRFLIAGQRLRLRSGTAVLRFRSGPNVVLQGPAEFVITSSQAGDLRRGRLTARLDAPQQQFAVTTPTAVVRDRGTEFGVFVDPAGEAHVHVFQGRVDVAERQADGRENFATQRQLIAGQSLAVRHSGIDLIAVNAAQFQRAAHLPVAVSELLRVGGVTYHLPLDPMVNPLSEMVRVQYPDDGAKLVDGRIGQADPGDRAWAGWNDGDDETSPDSQTAQPRIEFDCGASHNISGIEIYYLVSTRSAVHSPNRVVATFANDADFAHGATTLTHSEFPEQPGEKAVRRALIRFPAKRARYVRLDFFTDKQWMFLSEVQFLRAEEPPIQAPPSPPADPSDSL